MPWSYTTVHGSIPWVRYRNHTLHDQAVMHSDVRAAMGMVSELVSGRDLHEFCGALKGCDIILPVRRRGSRNVFPVVLADDLSDLTGIELSPVVECTSGIFLTTGNGRECRRYCIGDVVVGARYALVDDRLKTGGTVETFRRHLETNGAYLSVCALATRSR